MTDQEKKELNYVLKVAGKVIIFITVSLLILITIVNIKNS